MESYPPVLGLLFLWTVYMGLFGWLPDAIGEYRRARRRDRERGAA